jgi:hypothetical protein
MIQTLFQQMAEVAPPDGRTRGADGTPAATPILISQSRFGLPEFGKSTVKLFRGEKAKNTE